MAAVAVGVVTLQFEGGKFLILSDCLYVPSVRRNLILVSGLSYNGYSFIFNKDYIFVKYENDVICCGSLVDNLYLLDPKLTYKLTQMNLIIRERNFPL